MFGWLRTDPRRKIIREDRRYVVGRAERFLQSYLLSEATDKPRFYEALEGASVACRPVVDLFAEDAQIARATAQTAFGVVKRRSQKGNDGKDHLAMFITDAYATVTMAYRRAGGEYTLDLDMQQLGTASVHLLTITTSYIAAHPPVETRD